MAFTHPNQRRIFVPHPHFFDQRGLILPPLLPPPPLPPPPAFFPFGPRLDPQTWFRIDHQRTLMLLQFMVNEGLEPSLEQDTRRRDVVAQLKQIVMAWIRNVAWRRRLPKELISCTAATVLPYGSFGLGVHGSDSDLDALCVGPHFANLEEDFFILLREMLQNRPEVSEIYCVKNAKVPLMRFKFSGISVDFPYAQLCAVSVSEDVDLFDPYLGVPDETSLRSLSGVRANQSILELVPNLKTFQGVLRCVKLWARRRGLYSHLLGFFGGIHLAILVAYVCQRHPNGSMNLLMSIFFDCFSRWSWPKPVNLLYQSRPSRFPDARSLMPIMMPCHPFDWCNSNITKSTFNKIENEFQRGFIITREFERVDFEWRGLFEAFPYREWYRNFLRILLTAPDDGTLRDWVGWVKSRFRSLLIKVETVQGFCDPNPTEYVDHEVAGPNVVFYWGLSPNGTSFIDVEFVREDFMRSVNKDNYSDTSNNPCKLELSVVESDQLSKILNLAVT